MVFFTSLEIANKVIKQGLVKNREVKIVKQFQTSCGLVQCFKCYAYKHITKHCQAKAQCGYCNKSYETRNCTENKKAICANYTGKGIRFTDHKAWSKSCTVRKKTREALAVCFCNRLLTYLQAVCLDYCLVVSLVVKKELKKQGPRRPKGLVNCVP